MCRTVVLLSGGKEEIEFFHEATKEIKKIKFYLSEYIEDQRKINQDFYEGFAEHIEKDSTPDGEMQLETIEGYDRVLSRMIQDDFPIFELEVNKTGILSKGKCCFCLNVLDEDFEEKVKELVRNLAI